jgi:hypothetical protein
VDGRAATPAPGVEGRELMPAPGPREPPIEGDAGREVEGREATPGDRDEGSWLIDGLRL